MAFTDDDAQMVDDHIVQAERHVTRQEELVLWLRMRGFPTEIAEELLTEFRFSLEQHRLHRELIRLGSGIHPN